jgi:hypothetical protein
VRFGHDCGGRISAADSAERGESWGARTAEAALAVRVAFAQRDAAS